MPLRELLLILNREKKWWSIPRSMERGAFVLKGAEAAQACATTLVDYTRERVA